MKQFNLLSIFMLFFLFVTINFITGCSKMDDTLLNILPKPSKIEISEGKFHLSQSTKILVEPGNEELFHIGQYLATRIGKTSGYEIPVIQKTQSHDVKNAILLMVKDVDTRFGEEGYTLECDSNKIVIHGQPAGVFYGLQTLFQLLPPQIFNIDSVQNDIDWAVPAVEIEDVPRFQWRGMHLDVCRHFFPVTFVKRYIDYLAMHKFNVLHLHLTDDQGWRVEIKKYPRLMKIGAYRDGTVVGHIGKPHVIDGIRYGGFYTQDEIREIVQYAEEQYITVVPEIEMPGHSVAALTAYPHLSCTGGPFKVRQVWGIADDIYCAGNDSVYSFIQNVLTEVIDLFPSKYIHIGGDEAPKERWENCPKCQNRIEKEDLKEEHELQSYFIRRIETFLNSQGRQIIGWDEILEGGLAPNAAVMSWRGIEGGIEAAKQKHHVVMSPTSYCYFDYYQNDPMNEPLAIGGFLPLEMVYEFEPVPEELSADQIQYILGAQGNVWTEYIKTPEDVEYMAIPRMCALAEVVWSEKEKRDLNDFLKRMSFHYYRLDETGANYCWPDLVGFNKNNVFIDDINVKIRSNRYGSEVRYTLDGQEPSGESPLYTAPIHLTESTVIKAKEFMPNGQASKLYEGHFIKTKAAESTTRSNTKSGLMYKYFEPSDEIDHSGALDTMEPKSDGNIAQITYPGMEFPESFGIIFSGFVKVPTDGVYAFFLLSNDGSSLYINNELVVDNEGWHGAQEKYGQAALKAGLHPIRVKYFQVGGGKALRVSLEGPGVEKHEIQPEEYFY
jgi:hexosaminidase